MLMFKLIYCNYADGGNRFHRPVYTAGKTAAMCDKDADGDGLCDA